MKDLSDVADDLNTHRTSISGNYFIPETMVIENKSVDFATGELVDTEHHNVLVLPFIENVYYKAFRWNPTLQGLVALSGNHARFDSTGVYKSGTNGAVAATTNYSGYIYCQISKTVYSYGKIMLMYGVESDYVPTEYVPYEVGYTMDKIEGLPGLGERVKELELKPTFITGIEEIYLTGLDESKEIVVTQFRKAYNDGTGYKYTLRIAYADNVSTVIAQYLVSGETVLGGYDRRQIIKLDANYTRVEGFACINYEEVPDGTAYYQAIAINKSYVTNLAYTPNIQNYMFSRGLVGGTVFLNKDMESLVFNASKSRSDRFADTVVPLQFIHFTDVHGQRNQWENITKYIDYYEKLYRICTSYGRLCR